MRIEVEPNLMVRLNGYAIAARGQEFSGLGFCELRKDAVYMYDFVIFDVGNEVFTEIPVSELFKLMQRPDYKNMKVWVHRHPVGNGIPGWHNWSGTDNNTIMLAPLGGVPEMVRWSVSMVLTPGGWVGRIDNHITKKTEHLEVSPNIQPAIAQVSAITEKKQAEAAAKSAAEAEERQAAAERLLDAITARVDELDQNVLDDLGISREDLTMMALEQAGIYNSPSTGDYLEDIDTLFYEQLDEYNAASGLDLDDYDPAAGKPRTGSYTYPSRDVQKAQRRLNHGPRQA